FWRFSFYAIKFELCLNFNEQLLAWESFKGSILSYIVELGLVANVWFGLRITVSQRAFLIDLSCDLCFSDKNIYYIFVDTFLKLLVTHTKIPFSLLIVYCDLESFVN
ncbi:hypothetical protein ACJX0J_027117, partial [Zea mays]